jgi:crotonobetainyl-CoA:carnitine CoA-transferase CaiB-like acyl-CoA transferase
VSFPPFEPDGPRPRPDGIIRSVRGNKDWKALVEVKVGDSPLVQEQFDTYQRLAGNHEFDALITISSQAARANGLPPLNVDGRRLRSVPCVHLSWDGLLSEARMLSQQNAVEDPDQAWMLAEWIRYVADPDSRIVAPAQLGQHWNEILKAAREANLPSIAKYVEELTRQRVAGGFVQLRLERGHGPASNSTSVVP